MTLFLSLCLVFFRVLSCVPNDGQSGAGYRTTEEQIGGDMDAFYVQFFARYPFLTGGLYLTGEVYHAWREQTDGKMIIID